MICIIIIIIVISGSVTRIPAARTRLIDSSVKKLAHSITRVPPAVERARADQLGEVVRGTTAHLWVCDQDACGAFADEA